MAKRRRRQLAFVSTVAILVSCGRETEAFSSFSSTGLTHLPSTTATGSSSSRRRLGVRKKIDSARLAYNGDDNYNNEYNSNRYTNDANGRSNRNSRNERRGNQPIDPRGGNSEQYTYRSTDRQASSSASYDPRTSSSNGYEAQQRQSSQQQQQQQQQQRWSSESQPGSGNTNNYNSNIYNNNYNENYNNNNNNIQEDYQYNPERNEYMNYGDYGYGNDYDEYNSAYYDGYGDPYNSNYDAYYTPPPSNRYTNPGAYSDNGNQEYEYNGYRYSVANSNTRKSSPDGIDNSSYNDYYSRNSYNGNRVNYNYDSDYYRAIYQNQMFNRYDPAFFQANNADRSREKFMWINVPSSKKKDLQTVKGNLEYVTNTVESSVQDKIDSLNDRVAETKYRWKAFLDLKDGDPYGRFCRIDREQWDDFSTLSDTLAYLNERAGDVQYRLQVVQEALQQAVEVPWSSRRRKQKEKQKSSRRPSKDEATKPTGESGDVSESANAANNTTQTMGDKTAIKVDWGSNNYSQWIRETRMNQAKSSNSMWDQTQQQQPAPGLFGRMDGMGMNMEMGMPLPEYYNNVQRTGLFRPPPRRYKPPRRPSFETPTTMRSDPKSVRSTRQWQQLQKEQKELQEKEQSKSKNMQRRRQGAKDDYDGDDDDERARLREPALQGPRTKSNTSTGQTRTRRPPSTISYGSSSNINPKERRIRRPPSTVTLPDGVDTSNTINGRRQRPPSTMNMGVAYSVSSRRNAPKSSWRPQEQGSLMKNDQGQPFAMDSNIPRQERQEPPRSNGGRSTTAGSIGASGYYSDFDPRVQYGVPPQQPNYEDQNELDMVQQTFGGYVPDLPPQDQEPTTYRDDWQQKRSTRRSSLERQGQQWQQPDPLFGGQTQGSGYEMWPQQPRQPFNENNQQRGSWPPYGTTQRADTSSWQSDPLQRQQRYQTGGETSSWPRDGFSDGQMKGSNGSIWQQSQQRQQTYGEFSPESEQNYYD